jgi:hypothetical protein
VGANAILGVYIWKPLILENIEKQKLEQIKKDR